MQQHLDHLAEQARAERVAVTPELDAALAALDEAIEAIAPQLEVEAYGPGVGVEGEQDVYRLVIRHHEWNVDDYRWGLKVCDALPNAGWRVAWPIQGVARRRKGEVVRGLPAMLGEWRNAVAAAGLAESDAGRQVAELAAALGAPADA